MVLVRDIGEQGLLQKIQPFLPDGIVGDDGAVLDVEPNKKLVVTTDILVDKVHFSDRTTRAFDVGWRGATANLSDLAAMGAAPIGITVGLSLPGDVSVSWVEELYQGLTGCLRRYQTFIVGGDITRSETITVAIAAFGQVTPNKIIRRSNARVDDAIIITDYHGLSKAGLELLLNPELGQNLNSEEKDFIIKTHQKPDPRLDLLPILDKAASNVDVAIAGMDSSDGLADAIRQICYFSGVGAMIEVDNLPIHPILLKMVQSKQARNWAVYGGEDFELVLCLPASLADTLVDSLGTNARIIGRITSQEEIILNYKKNKHHEIIMPHLQNLKKGGMLNPEFKHFES